MTDEPDYRRLLEFRTGLRRFVRWSEQQAAAVGLTPMQHQLLLAVRGHPGPSGPTIGDVAEYLLLRRHSAVGLIDRAETAGLVRRARDEADLRVVRLELTPLGARRIEQLSAWARKTPLTRGPELRYTPRARWTGDLGPGRQQPDSHTVTLEPLRPVELLADDRALDEFDCGMAELNRWLQRSARVAASAGTAATYLLCRGRRVVGYYALAMSSVAHEHASFRLRRGMPDPVPVVLLARLAVAASEQGRQLGGHQLVDALRRCVRGGREFGARAVVVDGLDDDAVGFYEHFDFHHLEGHRLWRRLSDVARAVGLGP
ncbi:MAG: MarR family transcriptional regulator [Acidimicrobiia bacterium]